MPSAKAPSSSAGATATDLRKPEHVGEPQPHEPDVALLERAEDELFLLAHDLSSSRQSDAPVRRTDACMRDAGARMVAGQSAARMFPPCFSWLRWYPGCGPDYARRVPDAPTAFYEPLGGTRFAATAATGGPWSDSLQHGGPPSALLVRALELLPGPVGRLTRITTEFLSPVPVGELEVSAEVARDGASVQLLTAELRTHRAP